MRTFSTWSFDLLKANKIKSALFAVIKNPYSVLFQLVQNHLPTQMQPPAHAAHLFQGIRASHRTDFENISIKSFGIDFHKRVLFNTNISPSEAVNNISKTKLYFSLSLPSFPLSSFSVSLSSCFLSICTCLAQYFRVAFIFRITNFRQKEIVEII